MNLLYLKDRLKKKTIWKAGALNVNGNSNVYGNSSFLYYLTFFHSNKYYTAMSKKVGAFISHLIKGGCKQEGELKRTRALNSNQDMVLLSSRMLIVEKLRMYDRWCC